MKFLSTTSGNGHVVTYSMATEVVVDRGSVVLLGSDDGNSVQREIISICFGFPSGCLSIHQIPVAVAESLATKIQQAILDIDAIKRGQS